MGESNPYSGNRVQLTSEQKKAAEELTKTYASYSPTQLQQEYQNVFKVSVNVDSAQSRAAAIARLASYNSSGGYTNPLPGFSNEAVRIASALLGADDDGDVVETRELLSKVAAAAAAKGPMYVPGPNMTPNMMQQSALDHEILASGMATQASRAQACDAFSVYNPAEARFDPASVDKKRLQCANDTYGQCAPVSGGQLYPFSCEPTFEQCLAGNAEACSILTSQLEAGVDLDAVRKLHDATTPKITAKSGDALHVLKAIDSIWGHQSSLTQPGHETEYDILVISLIMDSAELKKMQKEHQGPGSFDQKNRLLVDKVWDNVQVPIIKFLNSAKRNPATFNSNMRDLLNAEAIYQSLMQQTNEQLQKGLFDLADSTDLMSRWLYINNYVADNKVHLNKHEQIALLLGIYLMKRFLFQSLEGISFV